MKKTSSGKRGPQDSVLQTVQPDKVGWIRKFCGKGIFREIWKNRFVVLRGNQLFISEKEVKELGRADEVLDLSDYERCEELRKNKSRSKKNHSKFRLQRCSSPGNTKPAAARAESTGGGVAVIEGTGKASRSTWEMEQILTTAEALRLPDLGKQRQDRQDKQGQDKQGQGQVPNLVFLAVSPEEKESWINVLNSTITRAKNRILDEWSLHKVLADKQEFVAVTEKVLVVLPKLLMVTQEVTVEDSQLSHLTRDRVKIPHNRRLPTRGHLLGVASTTSSDGMLTLDLIQEEDTKSQEANNDKSFRVDLDKSLSHLSPVCPRSKTDSTLSTRTAEASGKSQSLPHEVTVVWEHPAPAKTPQPGKRLTTAERNRCASMDEMLSHSETIAAKNKMTCHSAASMQTNTMTSISQLQDLINQKLKKTEQLLMEVRREAEGEQVERGRVKELAEASRAEAERLLKDALGAWSQAQEVLEEVKELRALYRQLDSFSPITPSNSTKDRKSLM
ncbi:Pleckstrin -like proteiny domain-containing family O member 1 [Channa argus]|uniref:Pleckstrin-like proteiny domain-containing family O member 1 n=1 Tax=Channa argus TaxID=215402 RepID=A0A6G1PQB4_CHAAH|nr:Pleckstrin -like proteiny domain-containing family O member 1 [Channa argus]